jgi:transcriptional regulator with XRE-family HTH domain
MKSKESIKSKFGTALKKAIKARKTSLHKLAADADMEYAHVQRIAAGKVNPELTTIISLAEGLNMTLSQLFEFY